MKTLTLNGDQVKVLRPLQLNIAPAGKPSKLADIVDSAGTWVVVEYLSGKNKGNRAPVAKELLK